MISKRLLPLLLVCMLALVPAAHAASIPDASVLTDALRDTPYEGYALSCQTFAMQYGEPGNGSAYAIAAKDGKAVLCAFEEAGGGWHLRVANENALPDDATQFTIAIHEEYRLVLIRAETPGGSTELQFAIIGSADTTYVWPLYAVLVTATGAGGQVLSTVQVGPSEETGKWTITENGEYQSYENHAYTRMDDFNLHDIPLTRAAADAAWHSGSETVFIELDDRKVAANLSQLTGQEVMLLGNETVPVYSGPDESYQRGAGGKASVSTKEPVTVYATNHDWILISYEVATGERFGYIPRGYLPADVSIEYELTQGNYSVGLTTREVAVLDNLSQAGEPLCILPYQTPMEVWATLGEWLYVGSFSDSGYSCRGFIPIDAFHHTNNF